ncbi:MAG: hypothetical protein J0H62_08715, partial [Rhizobiales bacterium]|nr:hypothetical protein [Hyphomicrobiales bacterium]
MANDIPFARLARFVPRRLRYPLVLKAVSFGLIGFVNAGVDAGVFFLARALLNTSSAAGAASAALAAGCACAAPETPITIAANVLSWMVAVTGSYVMNSSITFAAETSRTLR